jgi:NADPH:quinone reductase-like Zn-dependent oxidoreductase
VAETMKAIRMHGFGPAADVLRYEDVDRPVPAEGELLVRVHAAAINPVDWKTRASERMNRLFPAESLPAIPGWDVSGVVESLGPGVERRQPGDEVYALNRFPGIGATYAEYTTVPVDHAAPKPASLTHIEAAALPLVALTAWQVLFEAAELQAGQRVLIHAAAGGVGHVAVQLAKWRGAYVIGTASARNHDFLRGLGADECIDYTTTRFEEALSDLDLVIDPMAGETRERSWQTLRPGGLLVSILGALEDQEIPVSVRGARVLVRSHGPQLGEIAAVVNAGRLLPHVEHVFALRDAARAHEQGETNRTRGKIALQVVE